jgi:hypothetical protein
MTKYSREVSGLGQGDAANDNGEEPAESTEPESIEPAEETTETTTESDSGTVTTTTTEAPAE